MGLLSKSPSPLMGEGAGGGGHLPMPPHPTLPPQRGEGVLKAALMMAVVLWGGLSLTARAATEEIAVLQSGQYYGTVEAQAKGDELFLADKDLAAVLGGQVFWKGKSGEIDLRFPGDTVKFKAKSDEAVIGGRTLKLPSKVYVQSGRAYLPLLAFLTPDFAKAAQMEVFYQPDKKLLGVQKLASVRDLHVYSYRDRTRIELQSDPKLAYKVTRSGAGKLELTIANGLLEWPEAREISDGRVAKVDLSQEPRLARLTVSLADANAGWGIGEAQDPYRLLLDIGPAETAKPTAPAAPTAAASTSTTSKVSGTGGSAAVPGAQETETETARHALPPIAALPAGEARPLIVIDPGHGGKDSGARGRHKVKEKDITLQLAKDLADLLRREKRFDIVLTRQTDVFIPLSDRSEIANKRKAALFISIHCNAHRHNKEHGFEVYFLSDKASDPWAEEVEKAENASLDLEAGGKAEGPAAMFLHNLARMEYLNEGSLLAGYLSKEIRRHTSGRDRGIKQAGFYVLRWTNTPAVLVETAFITNTEDLAKLQSPRYRRRLVEGIYNGILDYARAKDWKY